MTWQNRIISRGEIDPLDLLPHPKNWRVHSDKQEAVLAAALDEVGYVQDVLVNQTTGRLIDGHMRVALAIKRRDASVPVSYVKLSEEEERLALATLDPISAMAQPNGYLFAQLIEHANTGNADLMAYIDEFAQEIGAVETGAQTRPRTGSTEYGADDFNTFAHTCSSCGFQFD